MTSAFVALPARAAGPPVQELGMFAASGSPTKNDDSTKMQAAKQMGIKSTREGLNQKEEGFKKSHEDQSVQPTNI